MNGGGTIGVLDGELKFAIPGTLNIDAFVELITPTSFAGRSTSMQVVRPSLTGSASTAMGWHSQVGERVGVHMEMDGFNLKLNRYNPTLDVYDEFVSLSYDPIEHAWWQFREAGGTVFAEVSPDGVRWNSFGSIDGLDTSSMKWDFGLGSYVTNVAPSESTADNATNCIP